MMRNLSAAVGALTAVATLATAVAPASAQDYYGRRHYYYHHHDCYAERRHAGNTGTVAGAATGGVAGALIGHSLVGGLVGAGVGAVAGHAIAKSRVHS